jgi:hypothetical protein
VFEPSFANKKDLIIGRLINDRVWDVEDEEK